MFGLCVVVSLLSAAFENQTRPVRFGVAADRAIPLRIMPRHAQGDVLERVLAAHVRLCWVLLVMESLLSCSQESLDLHSAVTITGLFQVRPDSHVPSGTHPTNVGLVPVAPAVSPRRLFQSDQ